jgi:hypothetical protein
MGSKEEYEAKKAERAAHRAKIAGDDQAEKLMFLDFLDRFVTAVERIADGLEASKGVAPEYAKEAYRGLGD